MMATFLPLGSFSCAFSSEVSSYCLNNFSKIYLLLEFDEETPIGLSTYPDESKSSIPFRPIKD